MQINPETLMIGFGFVVFTIIAYCSFKIARIKKKYLLFVVLRPDDFIKDLKLLFWSMVLGVIFLSMETAALIFIGFVYPEWFMLLYTPIAFISIALIAIAFVRWYRRLRW